jgi:hypothetical protein
VYPAVCNLLRLQSSVDLVAAGLLNDYVYRVLILQAHLYAMLDSEKIGNR